MMYAKSCQVYTNNGHEAEADEANMGAVRGLPIRIQSRLIQDVLGNDDENFEIMPYSNTSRGAVVGLRCQCRIPRAVY